MATNGPAIILDIGSGSARAGFAGEAAPRAIIPAVIGYPTGGGAPVVGAPALANAGGMTLKHPVQHGVVVDWDAWQVLVRHLIQDELQVAAGERALLLTDVPLNTRDNRRRMTQVVFDTLRVPRMYVAMRAACSLFASGRTTGVVVDSRYDVTYVVPIQDGYSNPHAILRLNLGGEDLTRRLVKLMGDKGHQVTLETARALKERLGYVAIDAGVVASQSQSCTLDGGGTYTLDSERFLCPEALFQPALIGPPSPGIHAITDSSIAKCDYGQRPALYANIVLSGGSTLFPGFAERLKAGLRDLAPQTMRIEVVSPPDRRLSAWIGGSQVAGNLDATMWISQEEYLRTGPSIADTKYS